MPKVDLPGGKSAVIGLRMADFRELWSSGAVRKLQRMNLDDSDLGELYPLLARTVIEWDVTGVNGEVLNPKVEANYDELEPGTFMKLMTAVAKYVGGEDSKN